MCVLHEFLEHCGHVVLHYFLSELPVFMVAVFSAGQEVGFNDPFGSYKLGISMIV